MLNGFLELGYASVLCFIKKSTSELLFDLVCKPCFFLGNKNESRKPSNNTQMGNTDDEATKYCKGNVNYLNKKIPQLEQYESGNFHQFWLSPYC